MNYPCFWVDKIGELYIRQDTKESWPNSYDLPIGAMFEYPYTPSEEYKNLCKKYPDGISLCVITPDGMWHIDGPSYNKEYHSCPWTRTGDPRTGTVDVNPSINFPGRYHGWLRNGQLINA